MLLVWSFLHDDKDCMLWLQSKGSLSTDKQQFGAWLRANQYNPSRKASVRVQGYEPSRSGTRDSRSPVSSLPSLAVPVSDGKATTICPSHLCAVEDSGMEVEDSGPVRTSMAVTVPNFFENQTRPVFEEVIQELDNAINKVLTVLNSNSKLSPAVGVLDGWVDRLDNFKNLDKGYLFKEATSAERIRMGDSDS